MTTIKLETLVQIVSALAILIGIGLVVWELKQSRDLMRSQLISDSLITAEQTNVALMGEDPMSAISRFCTSDELLTDKDFRIVNLYLQTKFLQVSRQIEINKASGLYDEKEWQRLATFQFANIGGLEFGKWWWAEVREGYKVLQPELTALGDKIVNETTEVGCASFYNRYKERFRQDK